jgi:hypothetical protein
MPRVRRNFTGTSVTTRQPFALISTARHAAWDFRLAVLAAEALDRQAAARVVLDEQGVTYVDRFKAPRPRPEVKVAQDAALLHARLVRELRLSEEPPPDPRVPAREGGGADVARRRWRPRGRLESLTPAWRAFFEDGHEYGPPGGPGKWGVALLWFRYEEMWRDFGEALVAEWAEEHAGRRPWAWWRYTATEPRQVVSGHELLMPVTAPGDWEHVWRSSFGIPCFVPSPAVGVVGMPRVEAEAVYLERLGLLLPNERERLTADDFLPEDVFGDEPGVSFGAREQGD